MRITTRLINSGLSTVISNGRLAVSLPTSMFEGETMESAILNQLGNEIRLLSQLEGTERINRQIKRVETFETLLDQYQIGIDLNSDYDADEIWSI